MLCLKDKIALVTGASRGIGQAIALELGRQGAIVVGTATSSSGAEQITQDLHEKGIQGAGYCLNVTQTESIQQMLSQCAEDFGHPAIVVNNAGITRDNLLLRMSNQEWQDVIDTNLTAVFQLSKACLRSMLKARWGRIINIASVVALTGNPGQANYTAAKAGLIAFSKSLALEVASRNITCNIVAPGFIQTDMVEKLDAEQKKTILERVPLNRMGRVEEIAYAVSFLASPLAAYITGATLNINGGLWMG